MTENTAESSAAITGPKITITLNGPYAVEGAIPLSKQIIENVTWTSCQAAQRPMADAADHVA